MSQSAYVDVHGDPVALSARDAVLAIEPQAIARRGMGNAWWVCRSDRRDAKLIGTGETEESAWRDAWSRMLVESMKSEKRG